MNELFYFTPFVFMDAANDKLVFQTGINFQLEINYEKELVEAICEHKGFTFVELQKWFDGKQIVNLFQNNILVEKS